MNYTLAAPTTTPLFRLGCNLLLRVINNEFVVFGASGLEFFFSTMAKKILFERKIFHILMMENTAYSFQKKSTLSFFKFHAGAQSSGY